MGKLKSFGILALLVLFLVLVGSILMGQSVGDAEKGQSGQSIQGNIKDSEGLPLPGVTVSVKGTILATVTDDYGNYALSGVPEGNWMVIASLPSFQTLETPVSVVPGPSVRLDLRLQVAQMNYEVTVRYDTPKLMDASESIGVVSLSPVQVSTLPSLGEKDIFRSLQLMPGISASNEASAGLYVRGGTPDQNLVLLDGMTVYNVDHFYGIFSAFNAQVIDNITMHKGGFESKYGGRISSVVELDGRSGNRDEIAFGGGASLLSYNGYSEVPISRNLSVLFAGRRSFQSPLSDRIRDSYAKDEGQGPGGRGPAGMTTQPDSVFYDVNSRLTYDLGRRDHLFLSFYNGQDNLDSSRDMSLPQGFGSQTRAITGAITNLSRWGNTGGSLNWFHQWAERFTSSLTLAYSRYFKERDRRSTMTLTDPDTDEETTTERGSAEANRLTDATVTLNNALTLGYRHLIEFGAQATRNDIGYDFTMSEAESSMGRHQRGNQYSLYLQDRWSPSLRFSVTPGLRATYYDRALRTYLEPRLSLMLNATDRLRFKAAGGLYYQYANNLVREDVLEGDQDFWTLGDGNTVPVSSAVHSIVGLSYETHSYLFDTEAYRKDLKGLAEFGAQRFGRGGWGGGPPPPGPPPEGQTGSGPIDFAQLFFTGQGKAEGVEFLFQKKFGEHIGWITYSLGRVRHYFPQLSSDWYPASHDSTHEVKIVDSWRYRKFLISGTWVFATGKAFTGPTGIEEITLPNDRTISMPVFGGKNADRLPDYHRLDASVSRDLYVSESGKLNAGLSIFNAYNRANVWRREYDVIEDELIPTDVNFLGWTLSAFVNFDVKVPSTERKAGPAWKPADTSSTSQAAAKKSPNQPSRIYDFYGTIESMSLEKLTVTSKWGTRSFALNEATITGQKDFETGTPVHVYYKQQADEDLVTMVFRTVK